MNWQVAITMCDTYRLQATTAERFFVHKARNHNYGKSFEFQFYEIIIMSVQLIGYSP